jgi:tRNA-uridine aminocarboxypropyltransferase
MPEHSKQIGLSSEAVAECPICRKPLPLCVCDGLTPLQSRISLLILQHPQEQDRALGTARLAAAHFADAVVRVGLSWPSLSGALGRPVADSSHWAVLYLGSARAADLDAKTGIVALTRKGDIAADQAALLRRIEGIVLLDGSWSQAKALWWRNPWLLKCQRVVLNPARPSRYGRLRREPRREGLSTIEAAAMLVAELEGRPELAGALNTSFERMLARYEQVQASRPDLAPKPKPRRKQGPARRKPVSF